MAYEYHVGDQVFDCFDPAAVFAVRQAIRHGGTAAVDVVCYSEADALAYGGDDAVERYREDPDASVFERFEVRVNCLGRVP